MSAELFEFILASQKVEYVKFNSALCLEACSPGLGAFLSPGRILEVGTPIHEVFVELVGYESELAEIQRLNRPPLKLDWISQLPLSETRDSAGQPRPAAYFNLQIFPYQNGLLTILRDISRESEIEQIVYNRHNELDILTKQLIEDLKWANAELHQAYKTTLEGWARALEMRDVETRGHSERVVELTRSLAHAFGIEAADIEFYCYGALLHDIGKMGIPDRILLKPGSLDEDELHLMRQHTLFAENLLVPIKYLEKAFSIPAYHHEKWQGGGYPYGLSGDDIPLPARIFSVVDVYDALTSNRPYHAPISAEEARRYIAERSGQDFDPQVVERFLALFPDTSTKPLGSGQVE